MNENGTIFMPPPHSTFSGEVDSLFYFVYYLSLFFFVLITGLLIYFAVRYRRRQGKRKLTSGISHHTGLEILWTVIPTILVLIIFVWGFKGYLRMHVVPKDAIEVKVTGQKWAWVFDYANGANSVNELIVPAGKPIKLLMSSKDVIHSFFVPDFRIKKDVLPNRYTVIWFETRQPGEFDLFCTEYCGDQHSGMIGKVKALSELEYTKWLETSGIDEDMPLAELGEKLYTAKACNTCHSIDGSKNVGPSFKGIFGHDAEMADGSTLTVDENYIRESILQPQAKVVAGYQPVMPTFQGILKDRELDGLIEYIKTLQ